MCQPQASARFRQAAQSSGQNRHPERLYYSSIGSAAKARGPETKKKELVDLSSLLSRRDQFQDMLTIERNHPGQISASLQPQVHEHMEILKRRVRERERQIKHLIDGRSDLKSMDQPIQSIPGAGPDKLGHHFG